jgi:hypothetical protein
MEVVLGLVFCRVVLLCLGLVTGLISLMLVPGVGKLGYLGAQSILVLGDSSGGGMVSCGCSSA